MGRRTTLGSALAIMLWLHKLADQAQKRSLEAGRAAQLQAVLAARTAQRSMCPRFQFPRFTYLCAQTATIAGLTLTSWTGRVYLTSRVQMALLNCHVATVSSIQSLTDQSTT